MSSPAELSAQPDWEIRPVMGENGLWDALDANGYGHMLQFETRELVEVWLDGYDTGARENA